MKIKKKIRATMFDPAFEVELEETSEQYPGTFRVFLDGEQIGYITSHTTQSERHSRGSRLVTRGPAFKAWAQSLDDGHRDSYDYYMQHRSQSEAIRRLRDRWERSR